MSRHHTIQNYPGAARAVLNARWIAVAGMAAFVAIGEAADVPAASSHWPQWRGPLANGIAPQGNPPVSWSETQNVKWKIKLPGHGAGTPIVWGNQIFVQAAVPTGKKAEPAGNKAAALSVQGVFGQVQTPPPAQVQVPPPAEGQGPDGQRRRRPGPGGGGGFGRGEAPTEVHQFVLFSIDRATGEIQWQKTAKEEVPHEGHHRDHGFASHSALSDGERVYAWFGSRGLHCYDLKGDLKWQKEFGKQRISNGFGEGGSPALYGDMLIVNWDHEGEDFIVALDKKSGKELWRTPREEKTTWTTPYVLTHDGKPQVVVCASQRIRSYDLGSGRQIWECGGLFANIIPTPVSDFGMLYALSGHRGSALLAIKLGRTGDLTGTDAIAWQHGKSTPYVPSPLLYGDQLYFFAGNNAILSCFNARTGQPYYAEQRLEGPSGFYASPVGASGRVYLAGRNGTSLVLKQSDKFEVLATNKLEDKFDASPAVVGSELLLRGHQHLYCIAER